MPGIDSLTNNYFNNVNTTMTNKAAESSYKNSSMDAYGLDMSDFMTLMVAQFTNQGMENTADISDMLNQLVQMQMVTALASMSTAMETMTDHSIMSYAASLVGKEVTVAGVDENGEYLEIVGEVTATGSYAGEQVIFVDDQMFHMTQIIAVGRLPEIESETNTENNTGNSGNSGGTVSGGGMPSSGSTGSGMPSSGSVGGSNSNGMPESGSVGGGMPSSGSVGSSGGEN